jgi:ATP/ADP translocase
VTWKSKLRLAYPDPNSYSAFMGNFSTVTGIVTFLMMFLGKYILGESLCVCVCICVVCVYLCSVCGVADDETRPETLTVVRSNLTYPCCTHGLRQHMFTIM